MTANEVWELARTRQALPENADNSARLLYYTARAIYKAWERKEIDNDNAKAEKQRAIRAYERYALDERIYKETTRRRLEIAKLTGEARHNGCEICKRLADVIEGL